MELDHETNIDVRKFEQRMKEEINRWLIQRDKSERTYNELISKFWNKGKNKNQFPQLSWIEQVPSKHQVVGSNPTGNARTCWIAPTSMGQQIPYDEK